MPSRPGPGLSGGATATFGAGSLGSGGCRAARARRYCAANSRSTLMVRVMVVVDGIPFTFAICRSDRPLVIRRQMRSAITGVIEGGLPRLRSVLPWSISASLLIRPVFRGCAALGAAPMLFYSIRGKCDSQAASAGVRRRDEPGKRRGPSVTTRNVSG